MLFLPLVLDLKNKFYTATIFLSLYYSMGVLLLLSICRHNNRDDLRSI